MVKPSPLKAGDRVALLAPAGACDKGRLEAGTAILESWGLTVEPPSDGPALRYMAGPDEKRGGELASAFADERIRAVLVARGGYGSARLFETFDVSRLARQPKIFVGFSDVSILLNRIITEAGLVCYHGPMAAADLPRLSEAGRERFRAFLFSEPGWWDGSVREVWRPGRGRGVLKGGCLSVLVTTLGTPYEFDSSGAVLFLEDVAEKPYRIDRMLTQLRHAGKFDGASAVVFGPMTDCDGGYGPSMLRDVAMDVLSGLDCPVLYGLDAGHGSDNLPLPFGCEVGVDGGRVELLEPVFDS